MSNLNLTTFDINIIGDSTGEQWVGSFEMKLRLSHREKLLKDKIRRDLIGTNDGVASDLAVTTAEVFSLLAVSLTDKAPTWWKEKGNGLDLEDDNVVASVYEVVVKKQREIRDALEKKAEAAKAALKEQAAKDAAVNG